MKTRELKTAVIQKGFELSFFLQDTTPFMLLSVLIFYMEIKTVSLSTWKIVLTTGSD